MTHEEVMHEWKNKALIMCDVDNCVINGEGNISNETKEVLQALINVKGHAFYFGMMSHRPVMQVADIYKMIEIRPSSYLIGNRGAEVYSFSSDQFMINQNIGALSAKKIYEELLRIAKHNPKLSFHVTYDGVWNYLYNIPKEEWDQYNIGGNLVLHDTFEAVCVIGFDVSHLGADYKEFEEFAHSINDAQVIADGHNITIINKDVNLVKSFEYIMKRLQVANNHVAVISKTIEDKQLFEIPGVYGITTKDAVDELKKVAKLVLDVPEKDFIAEAINHIKEYLKTVEIK